MISRIFVRWRWLRRKFNRTHWSARLLGLPSPRPSDQPGLILIQIDGLSLTQMERAMEKGNLPFLSRLIKRRHFSLETFYSGVPSTTPAVQGEIFFGVRTAVPSFQFMRRKTGKVFRMYEAESADLIEEELNARCDAPLLDDAHGYSNIFRAGARVTRYCSSDFSPSVMLRRLHLAKLALLSIAYLFRILRMLALAVIEFALAIVDMIRGFYQRQNFLKELVFVPARVAVSILLREAIRFRVLLDIESGVRIIHANFLGYDEQSHRRGPDSLFAHWTLKGIDRAIRDIYRAAMGSANHDYEMIVYSDHGQERTDPFAERHGRELDAALREVFASGPLAGFELWLGSISKLLGATLERCVSVLGWKGHVSGSHPDPEKQIVVTAMGPVGHVYLPRPLENTDMERYAGAMVQKAGIPLVLFRDDDVIRAFNRHGRFELHQDRAQILGGDHPFLDEATEDLASLCRHPDAGDFVISGWDPAGRPISFPLENGAHGGPGREETRGFLMLPHRLHVWHRRHFPDSARRVRGEELYRIALHHLERPVPDFFPPSQGEKSSTLRVITYNIHSCVGLDGRLRPDRIAKVLNSLDADLIAVQEIDAHRPRSGRVHQAQWIAEHLKMHHVFHTMLEEESEQYGIAIFSRHPIEILRAAHLTRAEPRLRREARGAIWLRVLPEDGVPFHFINTHFGLGRTERRKQAEVLLGSGWLGDIPDDEPVVLCGDFNSRSRSVVHHRFRERFRDVQLAAPGHRPLATFSSLRPLLRLDHIFVSHHFEVHAAHVPDHPAAVLASDHLPLFAELSLDPSK